MTQKNKDKKCIKNMHVSIPILRVDAEKNLQRLYIYIYLFCRISVNTSVISVNEWLSQLPSERNYV